MESQEEKGCEMHILTWPVQYKYVLVSLLRNTPGGRLVLQFVKKGDVAGIDAVFFQVINSFPGLLKCVLL